MGTTQAALDFTATHVRRWGDGLNHVSWCDITGDSAEFSRRCDYASTTRVPLIADEPVVTCFECLRLRGWGGWP